MEGVTFIRHVGTIDTRRHCRDVPLLKLENNEYSQAGSLWDSLDSVVAASIRFRLLFVYIR